MICGSNFASRSDAPSCLFQGAELREGSLSEVPGDWPLDVSVYGQEKVCPPAVTHQGNDQANETGRRQTETRALVSHIPFAVESCGSSIRHLFSVEIASGFIIHD